MEIFGLPVQISGKSSEEIPTKTSGCITERMPWKKSREISERIFIENPGGTRRRIEARLNLWRNPNGGILIEIHGKKKSRKNGTLENKQN